MASAEVRHVAGRGHGAVGQRADEARAQVGKGIAILLQTRPGAVVQVLEGLRRREPHIHHRRLDIVVQDARVAAEGFSLYPEVPSVTPTAYTRSYFAILFIVVVDAVLLHLGVVGISYSAIVNLSRRRVPLPVFPLGVVSGPVTS